MSGLNTDRDARNEKSRDRATRNWQKWTDGEDEFLLENWISLKPVDRNEVEVAARLLRTIEACRQRAHVIQFGRECDVRGPNPPPAPAPQPRWLDDDEWPDYYVRG